MRTGEKKTTYLPLRPPALYQGPTLVGPQKNRKRSGFSPPPWRVQQKMLRETIQAGAKAQIFVGLNGPTKVGP